LIYFNSEVLFKIVRIVVQISSKIKINFNTYHFECVICII